LRPLVLASVDLSIRRLAKASLPVEFSKSEKVRKTFIYRAETQNRPKNQFGKIQNIPPNDLDFTDEFMSHPANGCRYYALAK
jgi:hypothetical protein